MILVFLYLKYKNQCVKLIEEHWGHRERGSIPTHRSLSDHFYTLWKAIFSITGQCCCLLITFPLEISTLSSEKIFWTELIMRWSLSHCSLDTFLLEQEHSLYTRVHNWLALCLGISAALYNEAKGRLSDGKNSQDPDLSLQHMAGISTCVLVMSAATWSLHNPGSCALKLKQLPSAAFLSKRVLQQHLCCEKAMWGRITCIISELRLCMLVWGQYIRSVIISNQTPFI